MDTTFKMLFSKGNVCTMNTAIRKWLCSFPPQKLAYIKVPSLLIVKVIPFNIISSLSKKWEKLEAIYFKYLHIFNGIELIMQ
jgi:hypothetical protein